MLCLLHFIIASILQCSDPKSRFTKLKRFKSQNNLQISLTISHHVWPSKTLLDHHHTIQKIDWREVWNNYSDEPLPSLIWELCDWIVIAPKALHHCSSDEPLPSLIVELCDLNLAAPKALRHCSLTNSRFVKYGQEFVTPKSLNIATMSARLSSSLYKGWNQN